MRWLGLLTFILLPVAYCVLHAPYGFDDTDQGFVQALSWRVQLGQLPHVDFDYARPPLTPLLHALEMWLLPQGYEVLGARCNMYLMMWASVLFTLLAMRKAFGWQADLRFWLVGCMAFVLTAHNYPPMPWHTVDGVFFVALGVFLLAHSQRRIALVAAMLSLLLSALCKQPFALMPVLALAWVALAQGRKAFLLALGALLGQGALLALCSYLVHPDLLGGMASQTFGASQGGDLLQAGGLRYGWGLVLALPMIAVSFLPATLRRWMGWAMLLLVMATALALHVWRAAGTLQFVEPSFHLFQALFVAACFHTLRQWVLSREKGWLLLLLALAGAWASSISWGYQTPALFAAPIWLGMVLLCADGVALRMPQAVHAALLLLALGTYHYLLQFPYRDAHRSADYVHLGDTEPRLQGIFAGPGQAHRLQSFRKIIEGQQTGPWTVFPSMPLVHYLHHTPNPLRSDWEHNAEMAQGLKEKEWSGQLNGLVHVVYLERDKLEQIGKQGRYNCMRCQEVRWEAWQVTDKYPASPFLVSINFGYMP